MFIISVSLTVGVPVAVKTAPVFVSEEVVNGLSRGLLPPMSTAVQENGATDNGVGKV